MPLEQLNIDFHGKSPESFGKNTFVLVAICDASSYVWAVPIKSKDAVVSVIRNPIKEVRASEGVDWTDKVVKNIRPGDEAVLRFTAWRDMLVEMGVSETHSAPYSPQQSEVVGDSCER